MMAADSMQAERRPGPVWWTVLLVLAGFVAFAAGLAAGQRQEQRKAEAAGCGWWTVGAGGVEEFVYGREAE